MSIKVEIKQDKKHSATGYLVLDGGVWKFYSSAFNSPSLDADFMRQIADKLDELNGVRNDK